MNHIAGMSTIGGPSAGPASSASTVTFGSSLSRLATVAPAEPTPTTMKSYSSAIPQSWCAGSILGTPSPEAPQSVLQLLVHEGVEGARVVVVLHVDDLAVLEAEV